MHHALYIAFLFALGSCVGSFLNVVVWRLPRVEGPPDEGNLRWMVRSWKALSWPPSHCPRCGNTLKWYDNIPVIGWLKLWGKCRFCKEPISPRYPIVEAATGLLFVFYYLMIFVLKVGPTCPPLPMRGDPLADPNWRVWAVFALYLFMIAALLAASLIDADTSTIPLSIPYVIAVVGLVVHTLADQPHLPGALNLVFPAPGPGQPVPSLLNALAAGGAAGLVASFVLWRCGVIPTSFPKGEPLLDVDREALEEELKQARREGREKELLDEIGPMPPAYSRGQIRAEIGREMLFLLPPMAVGLAWVFAVAYIKPLREAWTSAVSHDWVTAMLGSLFGAMVGGLVVWLTRIAGTIGFGRVAMGLGDVHLMFGVGAVIGAGPATVAFFVAPFFGLVLAVYRMFARKSHELPYGPYLSMASAAVILCYCPIADYLAPGVSAIASLF